MTDFLLELRSEEIPARMQDKARDDLARLFAAELDKAGLRADAIVTFATPRRLALIARDLPAETAAVSEEVKGPRVGARRRRRSKASCARPASPPTSSSNVTVCCSR